MFPKRFLSALLIAALMLIPAGMVFAQDETEDETIVDIVGDNDDLSTLVAALATADLMDALRDDGPFTVFAPTNEAFNELPEGLLETLVDDPGGDLTQILLYHVVDGIVLAEDISDGLQVETQQGGYVVFTIDGEGVVINDADIVTTDIQASNGVIHVINRVLLPPSEVELYDDEEVDDDHDMAGEEVDEEADVEIAEDGDAPAVTIEDQVSDGMIVTVSAVDAAQAGWMVIHLDEDGRPGPVIGQTGVPAGMTENVIIFLAEEISGETDLWAMLHIDDGQIGVYEFPGPDVPARVNDTIVMVAFTASAPEMVAEAVMEEEVVEEVIAEEVAEEEVIAEEVIAEEVAQEPAPATLPATGGGMTGVLPAISVAALLILALAAGSFVTRRRLA